MTSNIEYDPYLLSEVLKVGGRLKGPKGLKWQRWQYIAEDFHYLPLFFHMSRRRRGM